MKGLFKHRFSNESQENDDSLLELWSYPNEPDRRVEVDACAQTPDKHGQVLCWRRRSRCNNPNCQDPVTGLPHQFSGDERGLLNCPLCKKDRHCRKKVTPPNRGCCKHGGKSPTGYDHPRTKTGKYSKYIQNDSLRADYEEMLSNPALLSIEEHIALLYAQIKEVTKSFDGGISRELLKQMKANRDAYKKEIKRKEPDALLLRRLDHDLNGMIADGAKQHHVRGEWGGLVDRFARLVGQRDAHVQNERMMITSDRAWLMLSDIQETFNVCVAMNAEVNDDDVVFMLSAVENYSLRMREVNALPENCQITLEQHAKNQRTDATLALKKEIYDHYQSKKKKGLAYASKRFRELAGNSVLPNAGE